jgi:hypothetical protein
VIVKDIEEVKATNKFSQAGLVAEKQMAFYLKRAFGDEPDVLVLNSLRLQMGDDATQIDHLLLHEFGMIIIESKSVTSQVTINEHGEWSRLFDGSSKGMPSPVLQAKRQGEFLSRYLESHTEILLKKLLGIQMTFNKMPIHVVVAISDAGIINRPKNTLDELEYVCKADRAVERVREIIDWYRKKSSALSLSLGPYILGKSSRERISQFLVINHTPVKSSAPLEDVNKEKTEYSASKSLPTCKHCNGTMVEVLYGKYGYYLKCSDCGGNTAIRENCPACGNQLRVRKEKEMFFLECSDCDTSTLFHKNTAQG